MDQYDLEQLGTLMVGTVIAVLLGLSVADAVMRAPRDWPPKVGELTQVDRTKRAIARAYMTTIP